MHTIIVWKHAAAGIYTQLLLGKAWLQSHIHKAVPITPASRTFAAEAGSNIFRQKPEKGFFSGILHVRISILLSFLPFLQ